MNSALVVAAKDFTYRGIVIPSFIVLDRAPPSLSSRQPTDLYVLWKEYEFGIGGRKAAKDFTCRGIVNPSFIVLDRTPPSLSSRPTDLY
jgi:hypothetical protein